ncbi:MAG: DNA repair protein RecO, partial [Clostridia bacterium]|nr:DNA repair protein RecO [Clostridia bacterium]
MEAIKTKAIVTRAVPYRESDMIVTLVSVDFGRITASARGCLKPKAKLRYSAAPFNFGEYVLSGKNDKYVITECNQIESFSAITADIERYYAGFAILDALEKLSREADPRIFAHALKSLSELTYGEEKPAHVITTEFLKGVLALNGASLDFGHCNVCKCVLDGTA